MRIYKEISLEDFEFWGGAKDDAATLTPEQFRTLEAILEDAYPDGLDAGSLNDLFAYDFDTIKEWLGIEDEEVEDSARKRTPPRQQKRIK